MNSVTFSGLAISGFYGGLNLYMFFPILGLCSNYLHSIIENFNTEDAKSCNQGFIDNKWFGYLIFGGIVLSKIH